MISGTAVRVLTSKVLVGSTECALRIQGPWEQLSSALCWFIDRIEEGRRSLDPALPFQPFFPHPQCAPFCSLFHNVDPVMDSLGSQGSVSTLSPSDFLKSPHGSPSSRSSSISIDQHLDTVFDDASSPHSGPWDSPTPLSLNPSSEMRVSPNEWSLSSSPSNSPPFRGSSYQSAMHNHHISDLDTQLLSNVLIPPPTASMQSMGHHQQQQQHSNSSQHQHHHQHHAMSFSNNSSYIAPTSSKFVPLNPSSGAFVPSTAISNPSPNLAPTRSQHYERNMVNLLAAFLS